MNRNFSIILIVIVLLHIDIVRSFSLNTNQVINNNKLKQIFKTIVTSSFFYINSINLSIDTTNSLSNNLINNHIHTNVASATIAPLADVGVKEFLVKDGKQFLRLTLPSGKNMLLGKDSVGEPGKVAQEAIELVRLRFEQVGYTNPSVWGAALSDANTVLTSVTKNKNYFLTNSIDKEVTSSIIDKKVMPVLTNLVDSLRNKDISSTTLAQDKTAQAIEELRYSLFPKNKLPFKIPDEYKSLPRLQGRAHVSLTVKSNSKQGFLLADSKTRTPTATFIITLDGYHSPITTANFLTLVSKGLYDNIPIDKAEELTLQFGNIPSGSPKEKLIPNQIPLELFYKNDKEPVYGITSDDDLRATETMALPFQAYGAVGMARANEDPDSATTQIFLLKWRQALIAPGRNTLDGFYNCLGYITSDNEQLLSQVTTNDVITKAVVVDGLEYLKSSE